MTGLTLFLLGSPYVELGEDRVEFETRKAIALLAYLALSGGSHNRDELATLLWPEYDQVQARSYLRYTLWALKKAISESWLEISREQVSLLHSENLRLDVAHFREYLSGCLNHGHPADVVCSACLPLLGEAAALYRGDFMAGFSLADSQGFDDWQFFQREGFQRELSSLLGRLVLGYSAMGEFEKAISYARRWLALDRLSEQPYRWLMRLYVWAGQEAAAIRQYQECVRLLDEELGISPEKTTVELFAAIKSRRVPPPPRLVEPPSQLLPEPPPILEWSGETMEDDTFVARHSELARLDEILDQALSGQGRVVFITGEAGSGKTAILMEFARRAHQAAAELLVTSGVCNAQTGVGDPYLPFRQILRQLMGGVDIGPTRRVLHLGHTHRLWYSAEAAIHALIENGPSLLGTFVSIQTLRKRGTSSALQNTDWQGNLDQISENQAWGEYHSEETDLHDQYVKLLETITRQKPLVLLLDDLHWADLASINLLFHLARELKRSPILVVGAFRTDEVALGRGGERHPLDRVVNEIKRLYGDIEINLDQTSKREFLEAWLDAYPNNLAASFRETLFQHTQGQPLFTVELVQAMQERGELVRDQNGRWVERPDLDWDQLPARTEAVIEERIARLTEPLREILLIAGVEGEIFTAQVIARVNEISERNVLQLLSRELEKRYQLIRKQVEFQIEQRMFTRFQFSHVLFQQYLYKQLSLSERQLLHGEIAEALAELYKGRMGDVTLQLAHHYAEGGKEEKAVEYLLKAGDKARSLHAHQEAIAAYKRALKILDKAGEYEPAARVLMKLGLTYHMAFDFQRAQDAFEQAFKLWQRAWVIQPDNPPPAPHALRLICENPSTLDPLIGADDHNCVIIEQLFIGLVALNPELDVEPEVARSWEVLDEGRTYIFHLRNDVLWSDGTPVTAHDFIYAWFRSPFSLPDIIKGAKAFREGRLTDPDEVGVHAVDELTLKVELEKASSHFLHELTVCIYFPVPRHVVETSGASWTEVKNIVTNGPFQLKTWKRGHSIVLLRNPEYHGRFTGNVQRIELSLRPTTNWSADLAMYEAGELDIITVFPSREMERTRQQHSGEYFSLPHLALCYMGFDLSRPPFNDERVRQAFVMAIDRESLANVILKGYGAPATGGIIPPGMSGHSPGISLPYDPERARQLLFEAGYPWGEGIRSLDALTCFDQTAVLPMTIIEYLQAQWNDILKIKTIWETVPLKAYLERIYGENQPSVFFAVWRYDIPDPDNFLSWCRYMTAGKLEDYVRVMDQAHKTSNPEEKIELFRQADQILVTSAAFTPLWYRRIHLLVKPWVRNFPNSALKFWFWKDVVIDAHI